MFYCYPTYYCCPPLIHDHVQVWFFVRNIFELNVLLAVRLHREDPVWRTPTHRLSVQQWGPFDEQMQPNEHDTRRVMDTFNEIQYGEDDSDCVVCRHAVLMSTNGWQGQTDQRIFKRFPISGHDTLVITINYKGQFHKRESHWNIY